jgi:hypothetical protein
MAVNLLVSGKNSRLTGEWFRLARRLNPADPKTLFLSSAYHLSPLLCQYLLRFKKGGKAEAPPSPFADLFRP